MRWMVVLIAVIALSATSTASAQWVKGFNAPHHTSGTLKVL